ALIIGEDQKFATLSRFLDAGQSLLISPILQNDGENPFTRAKDLLIERFALTAVQRIHRALFEEKRSSEEKTAHLLSRVDPLLEKISIDDIRKYIIFASLPESLKEHVATDFDSASVEAFRSKCDALLDVKTDKGASSVAAVWSTGKLDGNKNKSGKKNREANNANPKNGPRPCTSHLAYGKKAKTCRGPSCPAWLEGLRQVRFIDKEAGNEGATSTEGPSTSG
ncbi:Hypothetical predicted protein, partial [Paramuricea clavata]